MAETDHAFATLCTDLLRGFGLSRPAGQCFAAIWRAALAPSADDLVARCALSRSGVSVALKELRDWGLVEEAQAVGERRALFLAPPDAGEVLRRLTLERERRLSAPLLDRLARLEDGRAQDLASALEVVSTGLSELLDAAGDAKKKKKKKKG